jgi:signal transduction histidine kinase/CheY-like chemotaxis protein
VLTRLRKVSIAWLRNVPARDETARGNGMALQLLLMMIGTTIPLIWPYRMALVTNPLSAADWLDVSMDTLVVAAAWSGVALIRRGNVASATGVFVGTMLLALGVTYIARGLMSSMLDQTYVVLTIVLGGLILGRRALWWLYAALIGLFVAGGAVDVARFAAHGAHHPLMGAINVLPLALSYLAITLVIDQCVSTLRGSVERAERREISLGEINRVLEDEVAAHRKSREQLIHAQKVEAVGRLAGGVAHDFNNILSVIAGYAEAREESDDPAVLRSALYGVAAAARRGGAISRKLLSFGRKDVSRVELIDLKRALRDVKHVLRQLFGHTTTLVVEVDERARFIRFDADQLELMILNIAANARDAMGEQGLFEIVVGVADDGERVRIAFRDNGHGMPDQVRRDIFEPFFTTKSSDSGSGLGLAVVRDLVQGCGGAVSVESAEGRGTTIAVELPGASATESDALRHLPLVHTLLVEDEDVLRDMWRRRLEADGFLVVDAGSAAVALRRIAEMGPTLHLVITDLRLGDNDPASWLDELRQRLPDAPVLVVSSHFPASVRPLHGVAILNKPCSPDMLVSEARRLVDTSRRWVSTTGSHGEDVAAAADGA